MLVYGWEGQAGNFADLVPALLENNFSIHAFDAPSHGYSTKGKTSIFQFIEVVVMTLRNCEVDYVVSHSFGGVATTSALYFHQDIHIKKYGLFTTPDRFRERIDDVSEMIGISDKTKAMLIRSSGKDLDRPVDDYNVSDFVASISVDEALIIHDEADRVIPISRARKVHHRWPNSKMIEISGTGHFRILRSPEAINKVIQFLG